MLLPLGSVLCVSCLLFIAFGRLSSCGTWTIGFGLGSLLLCLVLGWSGVCGGLVFHCFGFEEVLSGLNESHVHVFVADVVLSCDTVDRGVLDFGSWASGPSCLDS